MANTKGKIIIGTVLVAITGVTAWYIYRNLRRKRILNDIYEKIKDTKSAEGQQALFSEQDKIKGSYAFDPNFWRGKGKDKPNPKYFDNFSATIARDIARNIRKKMAGLSTNNWTDDEAGIISEIKKLQSQGQVSMVAYAYSNAPLNYGNLADDVVYALTGITDSSNYIKEMNTFIDNLPL